MQKQILKDIFMTVIDSLRTHKLRSALTLLGVVIGTAVVVMVGAVLTGLSARVAAVSEKSAPNVITLRRKKRLAHRFGGLLPKSGSEKTSLTKTPWPWRRWINRKLFLRKRFAAVMDLRQTRLR